MELQPLSAKSGTSIRLARSSRIAIWEGAVRSGKTIDSLLAWAEYVATAPEGNLVMIGKTTDTLKRNVIAPLTELIGSANVKPVWGAGTVKILGRTVYMVGASTTEAESRIRGVTLAGAYADEITILGGPGGKDFWQMLLSRLSVPGARLIGTTNPASPQHWLLADYLAKAAVTVTSDGSIERNPEYSDLGLHRYRYVIDDNRSLAPDYVASLKQAYSGLFYRRFILGEWVAAEGAVYPQLDLAAGSPMLGNGLPSGLHSFILGIDHGMTNPTHAVLTAQDATGRVHALAEHVQTSGNGPATVRQQADRLRTWLTSPAVTGLTNGGRITVVVDPAAAAFRNEWRAVTGEWTWEANNEVLNGIRRVSSLMDTGRLVFHDTPILLKELSGYSWDPTRQANGTDAPLKVADHGPDALRYALMAQQVRGM